MLDAISIIIISLFSSLVYPSLLSQPSPPCRYLPSDPLWPSQTAWEHLNQSISRKLIRGVPLAQPCYAPHPDIKKCVQIQESWLFQSALCVAHSDSRETFMRSRKLMRLVRRIPLISCHPTGLTTLALRFWDQIRAASVR